MNTEEIKRFYDNSTKIYRSLEDKKSKDIFLNRMLYNITDDMEYINIMIQNNVEDLKELIPFNMKRLRERVYNKVKLKKIVIYGAGQMGLETYRLIKDYVTCFCDRDEEKQRNGFNGVKVISPRELINSKDEYSVVIGSIDYFEEIYKNLCKMEVDILFNRKDEIFNLLFLDKEQYFDDEIIKFSGKEIFVDGGCLNFETSKNLLTKCSTVAKIYAFEPDPENAKRCRKALEESGYKNCKIIEKGLYNKAGVLNFNNFGNGCSTLSESGKTIVSVTSIDEEINDAVTFIKMDIEGAELEALKGAKKTIVKYRPKLAISIYHKKENIIDIPMYIKELVPDYKLYMRHYSNHAGETILYAVL